MEVSYLTLDNGDAYRIISIVPKTIERLKHGIILRLLRGERNIQNSFYHYNEYYVTAKSPKETFSRTFVLSEKEFEQIEVRNIA